MIAALKVHGSWPTSDDLFSTDDFLSLLNHQLKVDLTPMMLKLNEEYFLMDEDFTIVAGSSYRIPKRAIGSKLRDLKIVDAAGNSIQDLIRLFEEDRVQNKSGYYLKRNSVELSSDLNTNLLRMKFFGRPNKLVATTECGQIDSINTGAGSVVVTSAPTTFANGTLVDFIQNTNPYDLLDYEVAISNVSGTTLTFSELPEGLEEGDWIALARESPVPMLPEEMHPVLVQSALCKTLSSKKDKQYKEELDTLMRVKEDAINMLDPRVENASNKVRTGKLLGFFSSRRY